MESIKGIKTFLYESPNKTKKTCDQQQKTLINQADNIIARKPQQLYINSPMIYIPYQ